MNKKMLKAFWTEKLIDEMKFYRVEQVFSRVLKLSFNYEIVIVLRKKNKCFR